MDREKRSEILAAACDLFTHFGFKKTSIDDVAQKAGVAKGTVYLATKSKADLFYEVLLKEIRDWNAESAVHIDPARPAEELLFEEASRSFFELDARPLIKGLLTGEFDDMLPKLRERFSELRQVCVTNLLEILRIGIRQGRFRDDLDLTQVAHLLLDMHVATLMFHLKGAIDAHEVMATRAQIGFALILDGLKPRPGSP